MSTWFFFLNETNKIHHKQKLCMLFFTYIKPVALWCSGNHYCTTSFNKAWTQVLRRFKSCLRRVGDSRWWGSLTMVPAGNKAKRLSLVNHTTKTIHHSSSSSSSSVAHVLGICASNCTHQIEKTDLDPDI